MYVRLIDGSISRESSVGVGGLVGVGRGVCVEAGVDVHANTMRAKIQMAETVKVELFTPPS